MKRLLLLAGEESGLIYARAIAAKMREAHPGLEIRGYSDYGFQTHDLAVMGFWAVLKRIGFFMGVKRTMERAIDEWRPDAVCTVDYPGMNLKLAAYAKRRGIRAVHVVCPQVWAWKAGRIPKIEASLDRLCCFFPFEPGLFRPGFAEFVGHPLADAFAPTERPRADGSVPEIALLPGSRLGEIERHLPTMLEAVKGLDAKFTVPAANEKAFAAIEGIVRASRRGGVDVRLGGARDTLVRADCAVVASGTASLEAALAKCPTVLVYRVGRLLAWFARRVIKGVRHVGLANIVWEKSRPSGSPPEGEAPMPELLQEDFTAANVRRYIDLWVRDGMVRKEAAKRLGETMALLRTDGDPIGRIAGILCGPAGDAPRAPTAHGPRKRRGGVLGNVFTVGGLTAFSRVLGLVREMLQSRLIGAGVEQSAFVLAFAIPNMARKLFGEGALTAAFVPVFKGEVERGEVECARRLARSVLTTVMLVLGAAVALAVVGITVALGVSGDGLSPRMALTLRLVRILCPYMVFICGAAFGMGVLNALGRFVEGAFMPAFLNIVWIAALSALCFLPGLDLQSRVVFVSWAILAGGVAQMAFLFRCMAKKGYSWRPSFEWSEKARLVWRNTLVAAVGAGAVQLNYMLDQVLGQLAAPWAAGVIGYAERLIDLPLGVVGVAFGTVLLPTFSGHFAKNDVAGALKSLKTSILQMLAVMLPASVVTFFCAPWIVWLIYEGRAFDAAATLRVARALSVYGLGLCFFSVQKCLVPFFQARGDMKTPLSVTVKTVVMNASLNILAVACLPMEWRHVGLAASTTVCAFAGCAMLVSSRAFRRALAESRGQSATTR